ncbi:tRNA-dihydrouridine(16/17) synthase [NAD(P)(+)]-like [Nymphon striatum]|nr:tRNA-dihydrouridine(16/17) synthase [NAD(P)(+)]-like [Nymphon striatum]
MLQNMANNENCDRFNAWKNQIKKIKYIAAPMVDMSHLPFRMLWRKYGAQLCYTPMYHANLFANDTFYRQEMFQTIKEDRPLIVQFCANDPDTFIKAGKLVENDCDAIDLNLGCPQIIAKKGHYGSFLQDEWDLVSEIVKKASQSLKVPITCKIRILPGSVEKTIEYAKLLEKSGCSLLTVHGRTRDQKGHLTGVANWDFILEVKKNLNIPVFANGNILSFQDIFKCLECTNVDGVMSAEGILHNPAFFTGSNPYIWEIAEELMNICSRYPVHIKNIRTYLFRIWQYSLDIHKDLRLLLAEASSIEEFKHISNELKQRILPHINEIDSKVNSAVADFNHNEYFLPPYLAHSRPRSESSKPTAHSSEKQVLNANEASVPLSEEVVSKNALRKHKRYERIIASKKKKRKEKKLRKKLRKAAIRNMCENVQSETLETVSIVCPEKLTKKEIKLNITQKLLDARGNAPIVCVDLAYANSMSQKEQAKLTTQLGRFYGCNRKASQPFHIYFTSLDKSSSFYQLCCQKNEGFEAYVIEMTSKSPLEIFNLEKIVQLSPDAECTLDSVKKDTIYVLGGIVDETVNKNLSFCKAKSSEIQSMKLPILEYMDRAEKGTYSKILSINQESPVDRDRLTHLRFADDVVLLPESPQQLLLMIEELRSACNEVVFDILLMHYECKDWTKALLAGIPKRNGFIPKL